MRCEFVLFAFYDIVDCVVSVCEKNLLKKEEEEQQRQINDETNEKNSTFYVQYVDEWVSKLKDETNTKKKRSNVEHHQWRKVVEFQ